jgi:hypothetical protein
VFIRVERVNKGDSLYTRYPIEITKLNLEVMGHDIKSFSTMSEFRLQEATRLNSCDRCDLRKLQRETGGILLGKSDFVNFFDFEVFTARDQLTGAFVVPGDGLRFKPLGVEDDQLNSLVRAELDSSEFQIIVQFIFTRRGRYNAVPSSSGSDE